MNQNQKSSPATLYNQKIRKMRHKFIKLKRVAYISFFIFLMSVTGIRKAQCQQFLNDYQVNLPSVVPQSPDVAALMRHVQIPIDKSTGVTGIDIPITEIQAGTISLPIKLTYHASGIKVNDIASSVGLGWSLDAGGMITRQVIDKPDFWHGIPCSYRAQEVIEMMNTGPDVANFPILKNLLEDYDKTSDRYMFKVGELSGVFRQSKSDLKYYTIPYSRMKVTGNVDQSLPEYQRYTFEITDTKGNIYIFRDIKINRTTTFEQNTSLDPTWYISEIISADQKNRVKFHYTEYNDQFDFQTKNDWVTCGPQIIETPNSAISPDGYGLILFYSPPSPTYGYKISSTRYYPLHLSRIEVNGKTRVEFTYQQNREDIANTRLNNISVITDGIAITHQLVHRYSGTSKKDRFGKEYGLRMMLDEVKINNGAQGKYAFRYNSVSLPSYYSSVDDSMPNYFSEDFWGYYNGQNNKYNVPDIPYIEQRGFIIRQYTGNRTPSESCMKACILEEMTYPTGGKTAFEFESNKTTDGDITGGLRIKKIIDYSDWNQVAKTREYQYANAQSSDFLFEDTGNFYEDNVFISPETAHFKTSPIYGPEMQGGVGLVDYAIIRVLSFPLINLILSNGVPVVYGKVEEIYKDESGNNTGMVEYLHKLTDFQNYAEDFQPPYENKVPHMVDRGPHVPKLLECNTYRSDGGIWGLVQKESYSYMTLNKGEIHTGLKFHVKTLALTSLTNVICSVMGISSAGFLESFFYRLDEPEDCIAILDVELLTGKNTIEYTESGNISTGEKYQYDEKTLQVKSIERSGNDGFLKEVFTYPSDHRIQTVYREMDDLNILYPVVEKKTYRNNDFLQGVYTDYRKWYDHVYAPETVRSQVKQATPETRIVYYKYDQYGNPVHAIKDGTSQIVYIWGYGGQYPVAEIRNATYSQIQSALGNITPESLSSAVTPNFTQLDDLRFLLQGAHVTTYTYRPLVGVSSVTDPSGRITYYNYDSLGRLESLQNDEGKLVEQYEYHYKN